MSLTFFVREASEASFNAAFVCPECNATPTNPSRETCETCMGYGTDPLDDPIGEFAFNVTGNSARIILYEILNYGDDEKSPDCGSLDPTDVLIRLTTSAFRIPNLVSENLVTQDERVVLSEGGVAVEKGPRMFTMGYSEERLQGYVNSLTRLAEKALELDTEIGYED